MRRGVGHYAGKGLGGGGTGSRRLSGTARTAGTLFGALSSVAAGQPPTAGSPLDPSLLVGRSADEIMDAVVEAVRPVDGTQDGEASREAISKSLSELLDQYPDADLLALSQEQQLYAVERYIACAVFNRFRLDVGKTIQEKAPSAVAGMARLKEVRDYIAQTVAAAFRKRSAAGTDLGPRKVAAIVREALIEALDVFQGYLS
ncbi:MAG: Qat anti-phage system associated protein QatB [Woeseia sp.]